VFVDFETVSDLADDFRSLPERGGQPLIFMIGTGHVVPPSKWEFERFVAQRLTGEAEADIIDAWIAHLQALAKVLGVDLKTLRLFHWSPAETSSLETAYNSARNRHPDHSWPRLSWYDLLTQVARQEPITIRGAFGFGLKPMANALHALGLIETGWPDTRIDGLGAMVGAWWCNREAASLGVPMEDVDLMKGIGGYNEVDCKVMMQVLEYLRRNH
jgi:hypothetical protein